MAAIDDWAAATFTTIQTAVASIATARVRMQELSELRAANTRYDEVTAALANVDAALVELKATLVAVEAAP